MSVHTIFKNVPKRREKCDLENPDISWRTVKATKKSNSKKITAMWENETILSLS